MMHSRCNILHEFDPCFHAYKTWSLCLHKYCIWLCENFHGILCIQLRSSVSTYTSFLSTLIRQPYSQQYLADL